MVMLGGCRANAAAGRFSSLDRKTLTLALSHGERGKRWRRGRWVAGDFAKVPGVASTLTPALSLKGEGEEGRRGLGAGTRRGGVGRLGARKTGGSETRPYEGLGWGPWGVVIGW